eukprot:SAG31_NODE_15463_length_754_cov_0.790840_1_plen_136_part_00
MKAVCKLRDAEKLPFDFASTLQRWEFDVCTNARLNTDDTFGFASVVGQVQHELETRLPKNVGGANSHAKGSGDADEWEVAIMDCIRTATSYFKYAWAKTPVAGLVSKAYDHRFALSAGNRAQIEKWQRLIKSMRS